jgi:hypothetical protein
MRRATSILNLTPVRRKNMDPARPTRPVRPPGAPGYLGRILQKTSHRISRNRFRDSSKPALLVHDTHTKGFRQAQQGEPGRESVDDGPWTQRYRRGGWGAASEWWWPARAPAVRFRLRDWRRRWPPASGPSPVSHPVAGGGVQAGGGVVGRALTTPTPRRKAGSRPGQGAAWGPSRPGLRSRPARPPRAPRPRCGR